MVMKRMMEVAMMLLLWIMLLLEYAFAYRESLLESFGFGERMHALANTKISSLCQVIRPAAFDIGMALTQTRTCVEEESHKTNESRGVFLCV